VDLKDISRDSLDWIRMVQDQENWRVILNKVKGLQFRTMRERFSVELVNPSDRSSVSYLISHFERQLFILLLKLGIITNFIKKSNSSYIL